MTTTDQIAELIRVNTALKEQLENTYRNFEQRVAETEAHYQKCRQSLDVLGNAEIEGAVRPAIFQGLLIDTGSSARNIGKGDFAQATFNATKRNKVYLHLRTPINLNEHDQMFRFHLRGYAYDVPKIIDEIIAGYCRKSGNKLVNVHTQGNMEPNVYVGSGGQINLRIFCASTYYLTLTVDCQRVGNGPLFERGSLHAVLSDNKEI